MADDFAPHVTDTTGNAGSAPVPTDLVMTQGEARHRAQTLNRQVRIFKHVGGLHPTTKKRIAPTGHYLWRDVSDGEGREFPAPRFYEVIETVSPASIQ